jgi:hypothetical protein
MKTPMQELIEQLKEELNGFLKLPPHSNIQERTENCFGSCIEIAERMLEKEKDVMCEFTYKCRNLMAADEFAITHWYDKTFNTKEK